MRNVKCERGNKYGCFLCLVFYIFFLLSNLYISLLAQRRLSEKEDIYFLFMCSDWFACLRTNSLSSKLAIEYNDLADTATTPSE